MENCQNRKRMEAPRPEQSPEGLERAGSVTFCYRIGQNPGSDATGLTQERLEPGHVYRSPLAVRGGKGIEQAAQPAQVPSQVFS
jgi:hypothetical protein